MEDNIQTLILRTSQSMKELKIVNENVKILDKKLSKIIFEEKKKVIQNLYIKHPKKYFVKSIS